MSTSFGLLAFFLKEEIGNDYHVYTPCQYQRRSLEKRANLHISSNELGSKIVPIQDTLKTRRIALAGRILRQNNEHPMRMVSFKNDSASPIEVLFRRVGRPRKQWTYNTLALIWNQIRQTDAEFNNSREQLVQILDAANRERF